MKASGFRFFSLPSSGFFSPFPHGTGSLSVTGEYSGLEGGPPMFRQDFSCPALLKDCSRFTRTGLSPALARLPRRFRLFRSSHWPHPLSLATTHRVSFDVLSSGYLDVSVPRVRLTHLCIQHVITSRWGFPIRISTDQSPLTAPHGFSQCATSFLASQCQGIHQMPFLRLIELYLRSAHRRHSVPRTQTLQRCISKKPSGPIPATPHPHSQHPPRNTEKASATETQHNQNKTKRPSLITLLLPVHNVQWAGNRKNRIRQTEKTFSACHTRIRPEHPSSRNREGII